VAVIAWTLSLDFSYWQIWVIDSKLQERSTRWTRKHFDQGFAWRPGSASFLSLVHTGTAQIRVAVQDVAIEPSSDAVRIIEVPFDVPEHGQIEFGGFASCAVVEAPPGRYALRFEAFSPETELECRMNFIFWPSDKREFRIIRADPGLKVEGELLTTAATLALPPGRQ
jgi:hypothetical protein